MKRKKQAPSKTANNTDSAHRTRRVVLKTADVDEEIVPLVKWLNGFKSAFTMFSCQGELRGDGEELSRTKAPYVSFLCLDAADLIQILLGFNGWCETTVEWSVHYNTIRYGAVWPDRESLLDNIRFLRDTGRLAD